MNGNLGSAMRFYYLATKLKYKIRTGWDENHWNVNKERVESVAEHVYGTCILALSIWSEYELNINIDVVIKMLVLHEIGEVLIGDITPFDNITPEEKMKREHKAMSDILGDLVKKDEFYALLMEFDDHKTREAVFAYYCDKLEADLQCKAYLDMGCHRPISEQQNNVVLKSDVIQKMIQDGAQNAFDCFYEFDRPRYKESEIFSEILEFIKTVNTQTDFS